MALGALLTPALLPLQLLLPLRNLVASLERGSVTVMGGIECIECDMLGSLLLLTFIVRKYCLFGCRAAALSFVGCVSLVSCLSVGCAAPVCVCVCVCV